MDNFNININLICPNSTPEYKEAITAFLKGRVKQMLIDLKQWFHIPYKRSFHYRILTKNLPLIVIIGAESKPRPNFVVASWLLWGLAILAGILAITFIVIRLRAK